MATTTNFGWTTPDNTGYVKDGALAIRTLGSSIDTSLVDLKGGTTGQVLKKTSGTDMDFEWAAPIPTFKGAWIYNSAIVSVANVTNTTLTYNSEYYDTDNFHSTSVNTDRLTIPSAGYYMVTASVYWAVNSNGAREMQLQKNGTTIREANDGPQTSGFVQTLTNISYFAAADYITLRVYQDSGSSVNSQSPTTQGLQIAFIGA